LDQQKDVIDALDDAADQQWPAEGGKGQQVARNHGTRGPSKGLRDGGNTRGGWPLGRRDDGHHIRSPGWHGPSVIARCAPAAARLQSRGWVPEGSGSAKCWTASE